MLEMRIRLIGIAKVKDLQPGQMTARGRQLWIVRANVGWVELDKGDTRTGWLIVYDRPGRTSYLWSYRSGDEEEKIVQEFEDPEMVTAPWVEEWDGPRLPPR